MRRSHLTLLAIVALTLAAAATAAGLARAADSHRCEIDPGATIALLRVERDTVMRVASDGFEPPFASTGHTRGPTTLVPAGRVRLLGVDARTRARLAGAGIRDDEPVAYLQSLTYDEACRILPWTDPEPFVEAGEVAFVRGGLTSIESWIDGVPLIVVSQVWNYPYPRRRGLPGLSRHDGPVLPADMMFDLMSTLAERLRENGWYPDAPGVRDAALAWARANPAASDLEPARGLIRRSVEGVDMRAAMRLPSRLSGTYRVDLEHDGERTRLFFRTARPTRIWRGAGPPPTTADLLRVPHIPGYTLVGYGSHAVDSLPDAGAEAPDRQWLVWLSAADRPTMRGNVDRLELEGELSLQLRSLPEWIWPVLETIGPGDGGVDDEFRELRQAGSPREYRTAAIPLRLRLDAGGAIRADTQMVIDGRTLRVGLERIHSTW